MQGWSRLARLPDACQRVHAFLLTRPGSRTGTIGQALFPRLPKSGWHAAAGALRPLLAQGLVRRVGAGWVAVEERALPEDALSAAVEKARRYAEAMANLYGERMLQDFQSELVLRAGEAWRTYDPSRGTKWENWLRDHFRYAVRDVLRLELGARNKGLKEFRENFEVISLEQVDLRRGLRDSSHPLAGEDLEPAVSEDIDDRIDREKWRERVLALLTGQERMVVEQFFFHDQRKVDIARKMGISARTVLNIQQRAFKKIKAALGDDFSW